MRFDAPEKPKWFHSKSVLLDSFSQSACDSGLKPHSLCVYTVHEFQENSLDLCRFVDVELEVVVELNVDLYLYILTYDDRCILYNLSIP